MNTNSTIAKLISFFKRHRWAILMVFLGFALRLHQYDQFPIGGETDDEWAWSMLGSSLIQERVPTSWSYFDSYFPDYVYQIVEDKTALVRPVFDHPPLFALLPGSANSIKNDWASRPSFKVVRLPMVILGSINIWLVYLLARNLFSDSRKTYLATLLFATIPSIVFSSRLVVAENLLVTWVILSLVILSSKKINQKWLVALGILAILTKISGIIVVVSIVIYGLSKKESKTIFYGLSGLLLGVAALLIYASFFDLGLFIKVMLSQSSRLLGLATLQNRLFLHPTIVARTFFDGWLMVGLFSLVSLFANNNQFKAIKIFFIVTLFFIATTVGETTFHGWYNYVLFPLTAIALSNMLIETYKNKNYLLISLIWLGLLPLFRMAFVNIGAISQLTNFNIRLIYGLGLVPMVIGFGEDYLKKRGIANIATSFASVLLFIVLVANIVSVIKVNHVGYWESDEYFLPKMVVK